MLGPSIFDYKYVFHNRGGHQISFEAANQDTTNADFQYFGFISSFGSWMILRFHIIASAIIYEYAAGQRRTDYDAHWNVAGLFVPGVPALAFTTFDQIGAYLA